MSTEVLPRALARSRHIDFRVVVGLLLFVVGVLATSAVIRQAEERTPVLVATRPLQPGHTLEASDIRVAEVGLSSDLASLGADEYDAVVGRVLAAPLEPGQLLAPAAVAETMLLGPGEVAMSVGVAPDHATGGALRSGDRVMVLATENLNRQAASTSVLLSDVAVISVERPETPGAEPTLTVTLAVTGDDAPALAQAANSGVIDLVLLPTGASQ